MKADFKGFVCAVTAMVLSVMSSSAPAVSLLKSDEIDLNLNLRSQLVGIAQGFPDQFRNDVRLFLFLSQARLNFNGRVNDIKFNVELGFANEAQIATPGAGSALVGLSLLDFSADIPLTSTTFVRAGQFKTPYGRERLLYSGNLNFADRSIEQVAFSIGRDVGAAIHGTWDQYLLALGVFTGGGRNIPIEYIPESFGIPMFVLRTGWNSGYDLDAFTPQSLASNKDSKAGQALFLNAMVSKDTQIGHSDVFQVKRTDQSILINKNWNPGIAKSPFDKGVYYSLGTDYGLRGTLGDHVTTLEAEVNYAGFTNKYVSVAVAGARVEFVARKDRWQYGVRYAVLVPDEKFLTGSKPIHEITVGGAYYLNDKGTAKLILDFPFLVDAPVTTEKNVGSYILTEMPNQTSSGPVDRKNVFETRLMLQIGF